MGRGNTDTWLRKREVAILMETDIQTVDEYWKQGKLPGKRLFGGRIVIFKKSDVETLMETLQTQEPSQGAHGGSANGTAR